MFTFFLHSVYIGGEHKVNVVQVNSKNHNLKILNIFNLI
jgi:hypothetical protein